MLQTETNPWLFFYAWNIDYTPKTDLVFNTSGIDIDVIKSTAVAAGLTLSDASSATDWAAGKFWQVNGNLYKVGISTASISSYTGLIGAGGAYTGGTLTPIMVEVVVVPAVEGDEMDLPDAPNATAIAAIQNGLATASALSAAVAKIDTIDGIVDQMLVDTATTIPGLINAINQSASRRVTLATSMAMEVPDSGDVDYQIELRTYDGDGALVAATGTPTLTATGGATGSLSANLSAASNPSTGIYRWTLTVTAGDTVEQIWLDASAVLSDGSFTARTFSSITDAVAVDFTSTDRANLALILADTNELQTDLVDGGRVDLILDATKTAAESADTEVKKVPRAAAAVTAGASQSIENASESPTETAEWRWAGDA